MEIKHFVKGRGNNITAAICDIDVIGHSKLKATPGEVGKAMENLRDLVKSVFDDEQVGMFPWEKDGCRMLHDISSGYDRVVLKCDKLISLLSFFNRSGSIITLLPGQAIHLRAVCHLDNLQCSNGHETIAGPGLNVIAKYAKEIGVHDHVVVTEALFQNLSSALKKRFGKMHKHDEMGPYYVLDHLKATTTVELNEHTSENISDWVGESVKLALYDELDIFAYTNETLYHYFVLTPPQCKVRVLSRSWIAEEKDEEAYNSAINRLSGTEKASPLWKKAEKIALMAVYSMGIGSKGSYRDIRWRFFDTVPFLKGAILRNSSTHQRAAHIGLYKWDSELKEAESPYIGEYWSGIWLLDDHGPQTNLLDTIQSRFDELWQKGHTYDDLREEQERRHRISGELGSVRTIWEIGEENSFLLVVPGRKMVNRPFPSVAAEDLMSMRQVEDLLKTANCKVEFKIMEEAPDTDVMRIIEQWQGHVVFICRLTLYEKIRDYLESCNFPCYFESDQNDLISIRHRRLKTCCFFSPVDEKPPDYKDYCVVGKCDGPNGSGKLFIVAGIHGMGTWGGAKYLTDHCSLLDLSNQVDKSCFATLVECEFEVPQKVKAFRQVMTPETFS